jgi:hypothetical protein
VQLKHEAALLPFFQKHLSVRRRRPYIANQNSTCIENGGLVFSVQLQASVRVTVGGQLCALEALVSSRAGWNSPANGIIEQRNGTSAQTSRVYDTYTSATDYHRIAIATARATLSAVSGASVTATALIPAGAVVMGVTSKVTTALGTTNSTTGYKIGTATRR